jgi:hypothetical protein
VRHSRPWKTAGHPKIRDRAARVLLGHILPGEVIRQPSLSKLRRITVK